MSRSCPNCKTPVADEARFCRLCGTPVKAANRESAPVSPGAATAPLADEGRPTHGFPGEDSAAGASAPNTSRVRRAELENLLRTSPASTETGGPGGDKQETYAAPETNALTGSAEKARASADGSSSPNLDKTIPFKEAAQAPVAAGTKSRKGRPGFLQVAAIALLFVAVGAAVLAFYFSRRSGGETSGETPIAISDQRRLVEEKLTEAESLLASGDVTNAIARLRYAVRLDPSNARARRMLADALERGGQVNEAIEEYRMAVQLDPGDEATKLRFADALRRVGRTEEAREIYQSLTSSSKEEVARTAREKLSEMGRATVASANTEGREQEQSNETAANNNGASQPDAAAPGTTVPAGNNAGSAKKNDPAASYNRAVKIIEGKDIRKMSRAELLLAYELFQYAQKGPNAASASRYLRELDNELFVRRKRK